MALDLAVESIVLLVQLVMAQKRERLWARGGYSQMLPKAATFLPKASLKIPPIDNIRALSALGQLRN